MNNKKSKIIKKKSSVSLITINQLVRKDCLLNLYELIKLQTYDNIIEWIIVEGSKTKEDGDENKLNIEELMKETTSFKIIYVEYSGKKLSDLRNLGNTKCSGDIIVCMDDDDYYPPERVSSAVESLEKSSALIAGCSDIYLYEYFLGKFYKFKGFHDKHSTNNCMAYKKEYLKNHTYEPNLDMAEEKSFTNNFTEPMVQLLSKKCIIVSSHNFNTFNKREICIGGSYGINPTLSEVNDHPITSYIPESIFNNMKKLFYQEEESEYDIVYYTGGFGKPWDPADKSLGGSEQAIVNLSENWAKKGLKVAVYSDILSSKKQELVHNLVDYKNWKTLPFNHNFKTIILWRTNGFISGIPFNLRAKNIYWDLHDNFSEQDNTAPYYKKYGHKITKILLKSNYHKESFNKFFKVKLDEKQYVIIPNGLSVEKFSKNWDNSERNPYRFCYVSYYTRGLPHIIPHIWYIIKQLEPRAELHLYYGMEMFDDNIKNQLKMLTAFSGVIDHGRQPIDMIVREKYMSSFQLYITNTIAEIDCISIRESLVTGCIPLISNFGVFSEREGIHFNLVENQEEMKNIALNIVKLLKDQKQLNILREVFKNSKTILDWANIADQIVNIN
uniref:Glycosyltransferase 2-like domain-containing protein n=1 Tax=viral metagenome TaxID=1070528 RepID=A0A6C0DAE8_9ZZZZ